MYDECLFFNLSALNRKIGKIWQDEFSRLGLSPSHGYLLYAIYKNPAATQKELSALMELDASTITRFIDLLVSKGFLDKTSRGKGATFTLTKDGKTTCTKIKSTMDNLYQSMRGHFGAESFDAFVGDLFAARQSFITEDI